VGEHIDELALDEEVDAAACNGWIAMLDGVVDGNWKSLMLEDTTITASDMLMHIDAGLAFLSAHRDA
jgi:hypothetical protein